MPAMKHYDLAVLGAGSGNMVANRQFADWKVAICEEDRFGGTCLNAGCIPTKMLVHPADLVRAALSGPPLGVLTSYDGARWSQLRDRVFGRVDEHEAEGRSFREGLANVDVHTGHATFVDDHTIDTGCGEQITADRIVIATGSRANPAPIPGLDEVGYHSSDTVMHLVELPRRMAIVGGGYVAAEFAHIFSSLGTEVTVLQRGPRLLQRLDEDVSALFTEAAAATWDVRLNAHVGKVTRDGDTIGVLLADGEELETDVLLVATGRVPNGDRLGLERTGVEVEDGRVVVDDQQRTSVAHIWALGDVANDFRLKHVANAEARTVRHNLLHPDAPVSTDHRFVPSAVFTAPQIASVGLTSQEARERGVKHVTGVTAYSHIAYGWAMEPVPGAQSKHVVKLLADPDRQTLLGAHIIGPEASLLIQPLVQGMSLGATLSEMSRGQYWIHPALTEVVENALLQVHRQLKDQ